eukprot:15475598-Alexandrium_andersonii.AAC.1
MTTDQSTMCQVCMHEATGQPTGHRSTDRQHGKHDKQQAHVKSTGRFHDSTSELMHTDRTD